jgi:hypothetical protein
MLYVGLIAGVLFDLTNSMDFVASAQLRNYHVDEEAESIN